MKKLSLLFSVIVIVFLAYQCTDEDEIKKDASRDKDSYSYLTTDGTKESGSPGSSTDGGTGISPGNGTGDTSRINPPYPGQVTAAEWNDLANWDFWIGLGQNQEFNQAQTNWNIHTSNRYSFMIKDKNDLPVMDCEIQLKSRSGDALWRARTDNQGKAELWINLNGQSDSDPKASVYYQGKMTEIQQPIPFSEGVNEVELESETVHPIKADILFAVDATGSMGDEISYLKSELLNVINRVESLNSQLELRIGSVFYRDEGDEYLTRVSAFSGNIETTVDFIKEQEANGGGDFPEAVHTALNTALTQLSWSESARTRILFLLLDAPPHNTTGIVNDIKHAIRDAADKGIKIIPITASGIDKDTEFLMRFFAIATNGTYVFITDDSGIGGDHLEATVGEYEVELLNDLMVRLIDKYTR
jgi:hypothetical protein